MSREGKKWLLLLASLVFLMFLPTIWNLLGSAGTYAPKSGARSVSMYFYLSFATWITFNNWMWRRLTHFAVSLSIMKNQS